MSRTEDPEDQLSKGQGSALLIIDVQQGLFAKSTPIYRAEPLLNTIQDLIDRARAAGSLVVRVQHSSKLIGQWNRKLGEVGARVLPAAQIDFGLPTTG